MPEIGAQQNLDVGRGKGWSGISSFAGRISNYIFPFELANALEVVAAVKEQVTPAAGS